jgi:hypothetical protein
MDSESSLLLPMAVFFDRINKIYKIGEKILDRGNMKDMKYMKKAVETHILHQLHVFMSKIPCLL